MIKFVLAASIFLSSPAWADQAEIEGDSLEVFLMSCSHQQYEEQRYCYDYLSGFADGLFSADERALKELGICKQGEMTDFDHIRGFIKRSLKTEGPGPQNIRAFALAFIRDSYPCD